MKNKKNILIFTFLGVLLSVFGTGFIGVSLSLNHFREIYINLQLDVNKRQAESMARFLESEIENGVELDTVLARLQSSIEGTDSEKGFLCMFDKNGAKLICHPNKQMIGMDLPAKFQFKEIETGKNTQATNFITEGNGGGGLLDKDGAIDITYMTPVKGTSWMISLHENIKMIEDEVKKERLIYSIGSIILGFLIAILATLAARFVSRKYERKIENQNKELDKNYKKLKILNAEINQQKEEMEVQRDHILEQKNEIEHQKEEITASIHYARRIQLALLPPQQNVSKAFSDFFLLFKPRDIVSGDFYWFTEKNNISVIAVADSTGHGVPGAFMSMLGIAFLNEIVNKELENEHINNISADKILNELKNKVIKSLRQSDENSESKDGMDITVCVVDKKHKKLQFSGANNPLIIVRNQELTEHKGDKMPAGIYFGKDKNFTNTIISLQPNDCLYMFSDGYQDQFGGEHNRKFMKKNLKNLLLNISTKEMKEQKEELENQLIKWQNNIKQIDDIIILGIKI